MSQSQQRRGSGNAERPWNIVLIRTYTGHDGKEHSQFLPIGSAFRNDKGFTGAQDGLHIDLRRGDRIALFPPSDRR